MIQSRQEGLRHTARMVQREDDSPRRRQAVTQVESAQRSLAEEIQPLQEKIRQALQPPAAQQSPPTSAAGQAPETEKAIEVLTGVAARAGDAMSKAADQLSTGAIEEAVVGQGEVLDLLNDIFMTIAPFSNLLSKTTGVQAGLVDQSNAVARTEDDQGSGQEEPIVDVSEMTRQQTVVSRWSQVLPFKAEQELQQLQAGADPAAKGPHNASVPQQQQQQQQEGLKVALEKAVQTGPAIEQLAVEAAADLGNEDLESALPKQEEVLKLLKEIAETLPKQEQNEQDQQNQQDQGEGQQQENKQQDQQPSNQESQQPGQPEQDVSEQQAEALMRKVRERERDYRQQKKQLRGLLGGGAKVDKDW